MNTQAELPLYQFTPEQLKITNRKQAARSAGISPSRLSGMSRQGFTRERWITGAQVLTWLIQHPEFRWKDVYPPIRKESKEL